MRSMVKARWGLIVVAFLAGCNREQTSESKPGGTSPPAAGDYKPDSQSMFGGMYDLLPVGTGSGMEAVIVDLKKNFATDPETIALLTRLYGGMGVKLDVIEPDRPTPRGREAEQTDDQPDRWMTPPPPGFPVLVRIAFDRLEAQSFSLDGNKSTKLVGVTVGGVVLIKFPKKPAEKPGRLDVESIDPVLLAVNDYLLRKKSGHLLFKHFNKLFSRKLHEQHGNDGEKYRAYLDSKVEAQAKSFREYWNERGAELK